MSLDIQSLTFEPQTLDYPFVAKTKTDERGWGGVGGVEDEESDA